MVTAAGLLERFDGMGLASDADPELRLQARLLVALSALIAIAGLFWGLIYLVFREPTAALIPLSYSALTVVNLGHVRGGAPL